MKFAKNIILKSSKYFNYKFKKCTPKTLSRGDYVQVYYITHETKRRSGKTARMCKLTGIVLEKRLSFNSYSVLIVTMFKKERVKWRFIINSPQFIGIFFIQKSLNQRKLINL